MHSSRSTGVYDPRAFILHAALLRQGFPHCEKFPTAASRRSLGRVSVPVWPSALSGRLPIEALVGHYPANKLIGRGLLSKRQALRSPALILGTNRGCHAVLAPVSRCYSPLGGRSPTRYSPVRRSTRGPKPTFALDLHVLGTPPALILSQDQTLQLNSRHPTSTTRRPSRRSANLNRKGKSRSFDSISPESRLASIQFSKSHPVFGGPDQNTERAWACQPLFLVFFRKVRLGGYDRGSLVVVNSTRYDAPGKPE